MVRVATLPDHGPDCPLLLRISVGFVPRVNGYKWKEGFYNCLALRYDLLQGSVRRISKKISNSIIINSILTANQVKVRDEKSSHILSSKHD